MGDTENHTAKIIDFSDTLTDNPFDLETTLDGGTIFLRQQDPNDSENIENLVTEIATLPQEKVTKSKSALRKTGNTKPVNRNIILLFYTSFVLFSRSPMNAHQAWKNMKY